MIRYFKKLIAITTLSTMLFTMSFNGTTKIVRAEELNSQVSNNYLEEYIKVIVQLEESPAIEEDNDVSNYSFLDKENEEQVKSEQESVIDKVERITGTSVNKKFGYLINGFSINAKRKDIDKIKEIQGVKCITESKTYKLNMSGSDEITQAASEWKNIGYEGKGMVISIIDSGIDYTHKDLKNIDTNSTKLKQSDINENIASLGYGQYYTDKVPFGYNYADGNNNIITDDNHSNHGMHVAGIAAANGDEEKISSYESIKGVAPQAQLLAMRVFSNNSQITGAMEEDIVQAIEDSVKLGADVINMSLGVVGMNNPDDPQQKAIQRATEAGVICVVAAGNYGESDNNELGVKDNGTVSSLSAEPCSFSVAGMENLKLKYNSFKYTTEGRVSGEIPYESNYPEELKGTTLDIVDCGLGLESELENLDLDNKYALVKDGEITHQQKYDNIVGKGASGIIMYNSEEAGDSISYFSDIDDKESKHLIFIGYSNGEQIKDLIKKGDNKLFINELSNCGVLAEHRDEIYNDSSWGTTSDLQFKPEIMAPGSNIYSLANGDSYQYMSGTSMATPCISGAEALILESVKKKNLQLSGSELVKFIKNTSMNTAKPLMDKRDGTIPYSLRVQGAGVIQIENAVKNNVVATYKDGNGAAALKEINSSTKIPLTLTNYGNSDVVYKLHNQDVYSEEIDSDNIIHTVKLQDSFVKFDRDNVLVKAGSTVTVNATLSISDNIQDNIFVEGYMDFISSDENNPNLSVPFVGFYGDWNKENIIDTPNYEGSDSKVKISGLFSDSSMACGEYKKDGQSYIDKDKVAFSPNDDNVNDTVVPSLYFLRNAKEVNIEVLDSNGNKIRDLYHSYNIVKRLSKIDKESIFINGALWDGTTYDQKTGKNVKVSDGKYVIRVRSKLDLENAKEQVLDMSVKVDTKAPEANIESLEKYSDENGNLHYKISWKAMDEENGSGIKPEFIISVNGNNNNIDYFDKEPKEGVYSADVSFEDQGINNINIIVSDYAGNSCMLSKTDKTKDSEWVNISNLSDNMFLTKDYLEDGKYVISGTVSGNLNLQINGQDVSIEKDNSFNHSVNISAGKNIIKIYAKDNNGKVVLDKEYEVILNTSEPEIIIDKNIGEDKPYYVTEEEILSLNISIKDNLKCSAYFSINNLWGNIQEDQEILLDDNMQGNLKAYLENGLNYIDLHARNEAGTETVKTLVIMKKDSDSPFNVIIRRPSAIEYLNKDSIEDGTYIVSGFVNNNNGKVKINDIDVNIEGDLTFEHKVKLKEGRNNIKLYAEDNDGNVIKNYSYIIYYYEKSPNIQFTNMPEIWEDGNIYISNEDFTLNGIIKESFTGCTVDINGGKIFLLNNNSNKPEKTFSKDIKLTEGNNIINIAVTNSIQNKIEQNINVILDTKAPSLETKVSEFDEKNKKINIAVTCDDENFDYILLPDGTKTKEKNINFSISKNGDYTFKAYDKAKNEISKTVTVSNIKDEHETGDMNNILLEMLFVVSVIGVLKTRKAK